MIKFFRKIRYDLMNQNKTTKYLKYAIGEIILVMIGILLALQVNNWNESRKSRAQELNLAKQLLEDAKADSTFFESRVFFQKRRDSVYDNLLHLYNQVSVDSISNIEIIQDPFFSRLAYQSNLINNNPDAYEKTSNDSIKTKLRDYVAKYDYVVHAIELSNRINEDYGMPLQVKYFNDIQNIVGLSRPQIMKDLLFAVKDEETIAIFSLFKTYSRNNFLQIENFLKVNQELKLLLEKYIERNQ